MKRELTCIECPVGCRIFVEDEEGKLEIYGYSCPRGKAYASNEINNPVRFVTSTVRAENGSVVPVKTDKPVPKQKVKEVVKIINQTTVKLPINLGDVIVKDVFGANIIATKSVT